MEHQTAIQIINEAINIAISKGCFNLIEAKNTISALDFINQLTEQTKQSEIEA